MGTGLGHAEMPKSPSQDASEIKDGLNRSAPRFLEAEFQAKTFVEDVRSTRTQGANLTVGAYCRGMSTKDTRQKLFINHPTANFK